MRKLRIVGLILSLLLFVGVAGAQYAPIPDEKGGLFRNDTNARFSGLVPITPSIAGLTSAGASITMTGNLVLGNWPTDQTRVLYCAPPASTTWTITLWDGTNTANLGRGLDIYFTHVSTVADGAKCVIHTYASGQTINGYDASGSNNLAYLAGLNQVVYYGAWNTPRAPWVRLVTLNQATTFTSSGLESWVQTQYFSGSSLIQIPANNWSRTGYTMAPLSCLVSPVWQCFTSTNYSFFNETNLPVWVRGGWNLSDSGVQADAGNQAAGPQLILPNDSGHLVSGTTMGGFACTGAGANPVQLTLTNQAYASAANVWWGSNITISCVPSGPGQ